MGRANIYLSDELERRVRASKVPISEVCQQALTAAVEAAEAAGAPLGQSAADCFSAGWTAGGRWTSEATTAGLLRLLRDLTLPEIPRELLRIDCSRCGRAVEIQRLDAVKLYGPHATWREVGQRLLDDGCCFRTGRHEEDGCWPDWTR